MSGRSDPTLDALSERQRLCLTLAGEGMTSKEIGRKIGLSPSTVDNHIRAATARLQVRSRREAVRLFTQQNVPEQNASWWLVPPLGGRPNTWTRRQRIVAVIQIAALGTMVLAALVFTISGLVQILSR